MAVDRTLISKRELKHCRLFFLKNSEAWTSHFFVKKIVGHGAGWLGRMEITKAPLRGTNKLEYDPNRLGKVRERDGLWRLRA